MLKRHAEEPWPRVNPNELCACPYCDAIHPAPTLKGGELSRCGNCRRILYENRSRSLTRAIAFSSSALIFMLLSHSYPFLTMNAVGIKTDLTLMNSAEALLADGYPILGFFVFFFTIVTPLAIALGLLYLCLPLRYGKSWPGSFTVARWIQLIEPWSMLEVFLLGFIVSLLKLGDIAEIEFHIGLWALVAVIICLAGAMGGVDRREIWDRLELSAAKRK